MLKSIGLFNLQLEKTQGSVTEYCRDLWTWEDWGNKAYHHIFDVVYWNKLIKETA